MSQSQPDPAALLTTDAKTAEVPPAAGERAEPAEVAGTPPVGADGAPDSVDADDLRPADVVRRLDEYIVGQLHAKRAVAVALRNRVRRQRLSDEMRDEVLPKNILMIGPTGVGKTEIARRLARLTSSPFIKVEATKFTEVGYVGRDVESIIRDLLEQTITEVQNERIADVDETAREQAEQRILDCLVEAEEKHRREKSGGTEGEEEVARKRRLRTLRRRLEKRLAAKQLEAKLIDVEVEEPWNPPFEGYAGTGLEEMGASLADFFSQMAPLRKRQKRMSVADARQVLMQEETDRLIDMDRVYDDAIKLVEDDAIVFVDEVDKICGSGGDHGPDVSGQGVQRDLLPLLEGSTVHTRYGPLRTDHILFIAAGAFTMSRPSDLIPEFQGRFPIRVELSALTESDLERILTEPNNALTKQYAALLGTEQVDLRFSDDGIAELARHAHDVNDQDENIGARRLFTILEKVLEELSFCAEDHAGETVVVDAAYVRSRIGDLIRNEDMRKYIL